MLTTLIKVKRKKESAQKIVSLCVSFAMNMLRMKVFSHLSYFHRHKDTKQRQ